MLETKEVKLWKNPRKSIMELIQTQMKGLSKVAVYNKVKSQKSFIFLNSNLLEAVVEDFIYTSHVKDQEVPRSTFRKKYTM